MDLKSEVYYRLPFGKLIQKKIPEFIKLILPDDYVVIDVDGSSLQPSYYIGKEGDKVACASIGYFLSNGPMIRITINNTDEGMEFLKIMKSYYNFDDSFLFYS